MPTAPIIIIRKKGGHGGHHGGAWKVAYADFVTAMMALFIVLWLMTAAASRYRWPSAVTSKIPAAPRKDPGTSLAGTGENLQLTKQNMAKLKTELQKSIQKINDLDKLKKNIEMTVTAEGLRIELLESEGGTFFNSGSAALNQSGQELLTLLAAELGKVPNHVSVEGHTDAKPLYRQRQLQQLGTFGGPGERSAAIDAAVGIAPRSGLASARASRTSVCAIRRIRWTHRTGAFRLSCSTSAPAPNAESLDEDAKESGEGKPSAARRESGIRNCGGKKRQQVKKKAGQGGQPGRLLS